MHNDTKVHGASQGASNGYGRFCNERNLVRRINQIHEQEIVLFFDWLDARTQETEGPWKCEGLLRGSNDRRSIRKASQLRRLGDVTEILLGEAPNNGISAACPQIPRQMTCRLSSVDPETVHFTHAKVAPLFSCGRDVREIAQRMKDNSHVALELPPLVVVKYKGRLWSRSNRRLQCYKLSGLDAARAWLIEMHDLTLNEQIWVKCALSDSWFQTDHLSAQFFPYSDCPVCSKRMLKPSVLKQHTLDCK